MKNLALLIIALISLNSNAKELEIPFLIPDTIIEDASLDSTSFVYFKFPNAQSSDIELPHIDYSIDGETGKHSLVTSIDQLSAELAPGWHQLQFYFTSDYHEVYTNIDIEAGKHYYYSVYFDPADMMILTEKPVIYLYPEKEQNVSVVVNPAGEFTFTYPEYDGGWNVKASPDGTLKIDDQTYKYLFWEASEKLSKDEINTNKGFVIAGSSVTKFLEEKLTQAGLNGQERADFITFWGPRMQQHSDVFLQFRFNEECNDFGELEISPEPDNIYRIYVIWQPVDQLRIAPEPQRIPKMNRTGFSILEWGGQELPSTKSIHTL